MNVNELMIESHKLKYHPETVTKWKNNELIYPIHIEITPYNGCNHRCVFCCYDYIGYKPIGINTEVLKGLLLEVSHLGTKSIMLAGEGEPLLHEDISEIINHAKYVGLDVATQTNGVFATPGLMDKCIDSLSWIKFSIDANDPKTHSFIHNTRKSDFELIMDNLKETIRIRNEHKSECTIGTQILVMKENYDEIDPLYRRIKNMGADYLSLKPFSRHPSMKGNVNEISKEQMRQLCNEYEHNDDVLVRMTSYDRIHNDKSYGECLGLDFITYIDSSGDIYACSSYLGNKDYVYGNVYNKTFKDIWDNKLYPDVDIEICRKGCRWDKINQYLWELKHPPRHRNFI